MTGPDEQCARLRVGLRREVGGGLLSLLLAETALHSVCLSAPGDDGTATLSSSRKSSRSCAVRAESGAV